MNPPGVMFTPLKRIVVGPLSSAPPWPPGTAAEDAFTAAAFEAAMFATELFSAVVAVFTSADVATASLAFTVASVARELAEAAASRASSICRSLLANSSFNIWSCSCCACRTWRNSSISAAISAFVLEVAGFAAGDVFAGCASGSFGESFGESANAVPTDRNSDKISAASFFIASLFLFKKISDCVPGKKQLHPECEGRVGLLLLCQLHMNTL